MARDELMERIEFLEEAYEFFLSYAARGLSGEEGGSGEVRRYLEGALEATEGLGRLLREAVEEVDLEPGDAHEAYSEVLEDDARRTRAALRVVLARPAISSQLVDNLNASIHFRALLTDLFLVDELLKPRRAGAESG